MAPVISGSGCGTGCWNLTLFNDQLMVNLAVNGGTLGSKFANGGVLQLTLAFESDASLANISQQASAWVSSGHVAPMAGVPEPASLLVSRREPLSRLWIARRKDFSFG